MLTFSGKFHCILDSSTMHQLFLLGTSRLSCVTYTRPVHRQGQVSVVWMETLHYPYFQHCAASSLSVILASTTLLYSLLSSVCAKPMKQYGFIQSKKRAKTQKMYFYQILMRLKTEGLIAAGMPFLTLEMFFIGSRRTRGQISRKQLKKFICHPIPM